VRLRSKDSGVRLEAWVFVDVDISTPLRRSPV